MHTAVAVFAGIILTAASLTAQTPGEVTDAEAVAMVLAAGRRADPVLCELAARTVEGQGGWGWRWTVQAPRGGPRTALVAVARSRVDPAALGSLRDALLGEDGCVRRLAAPLLGRIRHASALQAVRQLLQEDRAEVRQAAAWAAGFSEDRTQIPALISALQDPQPGVRSAAAWALGEIEDRRAVGALARVLREDRDADVRAAAAAALGSIEG